MIRKTLTFARFYISNFNVNKDYYQVLNVSKNATNQQIKKSFRALAKQYHPDANKGKQEKFKQLNQAYQVLSSQVTKKQYDQARRGPSQTSQNYGSYGAGPGYQGQYQYQQQQQQYYRQDPSRQNTYRGYQQQTGWKNRYSRQQAIHNMYYKQQQQYMRQNYNRANRAQQDLNDEMLRKRSKQESHFYSSKNLEDDLDQLLRKSAQHIKITRQSVRKAQEQYQKKREQEYKNYQDKTNEDLKKQIKDRVWKMAQGVKDNIDGLAKVGKYVKQNVAAASKVGQYAKSLWDQFKNTKKK